MNKQDFSYSMPFVVLAITFAFISFMLFLSGGKSAYWLKKKMKIGAMMLSLSAVTVGYQGCITTCYDAPAPNLIYLDDYANNEIRINLQETREISGTISERQSDEFYFSISDTNYTQIFQLEKILAKDGKMDESTEEFTIIINDTIPGGIYMLNFYDYLITSENRLYPGYPSYRLIIENNRP